MTDDGQELTKDALAKLILEEAEVVKINFPDREETMNWLVQSKFQRYVENFAIRNNIVGADFKAAREAKKLFECEVCYQSVGSVSYLKQKKKYPFVIVCILFLHRYISIFVGKIHRFLQTFSI